MQLADKSPGLVFYLVGPAGWGGTRRQLKRVYFKIIGMKPSGMIQFSGAT